MKKATSKYRIFEICEIHGHSRQAYYKKKKRSFAIALLEEIILQEVMRIRKRQPRIGGRKLLHMIKPLIEQMGHTYSRDRFFRLLRKHHLLVERKRRGYRTTNSYHRFRKYPNLIRDLKVTGPNQVWVSDITYIRLLGGFCYLFLITDIYSRKIVGFCLSPSLGISGALVALKMALRQLPKGAIVIHHSDRGIQYCSYDYVDCLTNRDVLISMTEQNHVYENALAERVNGILKDEFLLSETLASYEIAQKIVKQSIGIYNNERPHTALNYDTPSQRHAA